MPVTKRGIYHNLKESKYTISNGEVVFFFSSMLYLNKFMDEYQNNREKYRKKFKKDAMLELNFDFLYDLVLYQEIEKRGFRATLDKTDLSYQDMEYYVLRQSTQKESPEWEIIKR
jgi:hypothetical protein